MNSINPIKSTLTSEYALKSEICNYRAKRCPNSPRVNVSLSCHLFYVNISIKGIVHPKMNILLSFHIKSFQTNVWLSFLGGQIFSPMLVNQTVLVPFKLHCIVSILFDHQHPLKYCILRSTEERIFICGLTVPLKVQYVILTATGWNGSKSKYWRKLLLPSLLRLNTHAGCQIED